MTLASQILDEYFKSEVEFIVRDYTVDHTLKTIFKYYRNEIEQHLANILENDLKYQIDDMEEVLDSIYLNFHKGFRQYDIVSPLKNGTDRLSMDMLIWNLLQSSNCTFFNTIENVIKNLSPQKLIGN